MYKQYSKVDEPQSIDKDGIVLIKTIVIRWNSPTRFL